MSAAADPMIVVMGLGYVGLPLAVALADHFTTIGFDIEPTRIEELRQGHDRTNEVDPDRLAGSPIRVTSDPAEARGADLYIVTVPTPVDADKRPDLGPVLAASRSVGRMIDPGRPAIVVYESTVYPGVTEEICGPTLEESGLRRGRAFPARLQPRADQSRRPRAQRSIESSRWSPARTRPSSRRLPASTGRSPRPACFEPLPSRRPRRPR